MLAGLGLCLCLWACAPASVFTPSLGPSAPSTVLPGKGPEQLLPTPLPTPLSGTGAAPQASAEPVSVAVAGLRFAAVDRFLDAAGERQRLQVVLLDVQGQPLAVDLPLEWSSSRPQDIRVSSDGQIEALVDFGYSQIEVRLPGTDFVTGVLINVNNSGLSAGGSGSGNGSGSGGGGQQLRPVIHQLQASTAQVLGAGELVRLSASASQGQQAVSDTSYSWRCLEANCNLFTPANGPTVFWQAPPQGGAYTLELTVSQGGQQVSQAVVVQVQVGQGKVTINGGP